MRVCVYDPDDYLVKALMSWLPSAVGAHSVSWDGKDAKGRVVADEAYYFVIEAKEGDKLTVYDPKTSSGGDEMEIPDLSYDAQSKLLSFSLPKPARVLIRAGLSGGPLLRTPVDWQSFPAGKHRVGWDGKDESGVVDAGTRGDLKLYGIAYALADCTVISTGNTALAHAGALAVRHVNAVRKPISIPTSRKVAISPFWGRSPRYNRSVRFTLTKPEVSDGKLKASVSIAPEDLALLRGISYEVIAYVDKDLLLDDERGHSPYTLSLDVSGISGGRHLLTVNVASVTDRIGTQSVEFFLPETPAK